VNLLVPLTPSPVDFHPLEHEKIGPMDDFVPKPGSLKIGGLSRKAQKMQALREKAASQNNGNAKPHAANSTQSFNAKGALTGHKKTSFNRKAV
jgi:hypothetical protein